MRNAILTILLSMLIIPAMGQERREFYLANRDTTSSVDIVFKKILENTYTLDAIERRLIRLEEVSTPRYKLYPTQNMWVFLKLDTYFGVVSKVQWSLNSKKERFEVKIGYSNDIDEPTGSYYPGRFELYPTTNIYNFILLDTKLGKMYQVQWGTSSDEDFIIPIE